MGSFSDLVNSWSSKLTIYPRQEAESLIHWLLEHHLGMRRVDMMQFMEEKDLPAALKNDFERLKTGEPIQYILGHGPFYGREFSVSPATLIPRNETEELVHLILKENPAAGLTILDIGTGTGCIPITLKLEMKAARVFGLDVSEEALEVAIENGKILHAQVDFINCDILKETPILPPLDILVSNPPYVAWSEKSQMLPNVLEFEPHLALFVPDDDPLLFYRVIGNKGKLLLKPAGKLYFEINEQFGEEVVALLEGLNYAKVRLVRDINGKNRIVAAELAS
jgi:release factor glutamine methyltransferase